MDIQQRPFWVRLMLGEATNRQKAFFQICCFCLITSLGWILGSLVASNPSLPANITFILGATIGTLGTIFIIWVGIAIRWVDRQGKWTESTHQP